MRLCIVLLFFCLQFSWSYIGDGTLLNPATSCKDLADAFAAKGLPPPNGAYYLLFNGDEARGKTYQTYCNGSWTLAMKIDGELSGEGGYFGSFWKCEQPNFGQTEDKFCHKLIQNSGDLSPTQTRTLAVDYLDYTQIRVDVRLKTNNPYNEVKTLYIPFASTSLLNIPPNAQLNPITQRPGYYGWVNAFSTSTLTPGFPYPGSNPTYLEQWNYQTSFSIRVGLSAMIDGNWKGYVGLGMDRGCYMSIVNYPDNGCVSGTCSYYAWCFVYLSTKHDCSEVGYCSGNGKCVGPRTCKCEPGFFGTACQFCNRTSDSLIGWWKGESNTANEKGASSLQFMVQSAAYVSGALGNAFSLVSSGSGNNGHLKLSNPQPAGFKEISVSFWAKFPSSTAQRAVIYYGSSSYTALRVHIASSLQIKIMNSGEEFPALNFENIGVWQHFVAQYRGSDGRFFLFVNGLKAYESTFTAGTLPGGHDLYFGGDPNLSYKLSGFAIDEIFVFNRVLSTFEISTLYQKKLFCCGKQTGDAGICSGLGACNLPDNCTCSASYPSTDCQDTTISCFGLFASDPAVCSGRGKCVGKNICTCESTWGGGDCSAPVLCFGVPANTSNVCSGNGNCISVDTCACRANSTGTNCEIPYCYGIVATDPFVCGGRGQCVAIDTCQCMNQRVGQVCDQMLSDGYYYNYVQQPRSWSEAQAYCLSQLRSNLTSFASNADFQKVNKFIKDTFRISTFTYWTGYSGTPESKTSIDGTPIPTGVYFVYGSGSFKATNLESLDPVPASQSNSFMCKRPAICFGIPRTNPAACLGFGNCVADDKCACNTCYAGSFCEFNYCNQRTLTLITQQTAELINTPVNVTVEISENIPLYLQNRTYCRTLANPETVLATYISSNTEGNRRFICTLMATSERNVQLVLAFDSSTISSSVSFTFLRQGTISFVTNSKRAGATNAALQIVLSINTSIADNSRVNCFQDGVAVTTTAVFGNYLCSVSSATQKTSIISLHFVTPARTITLSTNTLPVSFFGQLATLQFNSASLNLNYTNKASLFYFDVITSFLPAEFMTRLYSEMNGVYSPCSLAQPSFLQCTVTSSTEGTMNISLWIDAYGSSWVKISGSPLPFTFISPTYTSTIVPRLQLVNYNSSNVITISQTVFAYDNQEVTYSCGYEGYIFASTRSGNTFTCFIMTSATEKLVKVVLYAVSKRTSAQLALTSADYEIWDTINIQVVYPFIGTYQPLTVNEYAVQLNLDRAPISAASLFCESISASGAISTASISGFQVTCIIKSSNLINSDVEYLDIAVRVNATSTVSYRLSNIVQFTTIRSPLKFGRPIISPFDFGSAIDLNFRTPTATTTQLFNVTLAPVYNSAQNPNFNLQCTFTANVAPSCNIAPFVSTHAVQQLNGTLTVERPAYASSLRSVTLPISYLLFKQNVSILSEYPFIGDTVEASNAATPLSVTFTTNIPLNPMFSYACFVYKGSAFRYSTVATISPSSEKNFTCSLASMAIDESLNVSLSANLVDAYHAITTPSATGTEEFASLQFAPVSADMEASSAHTIIYQTSRQNYGVPGKYRSGLISVGLNGQIPAVSNNFTCSVSSEGLIPCTKGQLSNLVSGLDLQLVTPALFFNSNFLIRLKSLLLYRRGIIQNIVPKAMLRGLGSQMRMEFDRSMLNSQGGLIYSLFCRVNDTSAVAQFAASKASNTALACSISGSSADKVYLDATLRASSLDPSMNDVLLSLTSSPINIISQNSISFSNSQEVKVLYSNKQTNTSIILHSQLPTQQIQNLIKCRLYSPQLNQFQYLDTTATTGGSFHNYTCNLNTPFYGKAYLSLWYQEEFVEYQVSSNSLELIFVEYAQFDRFEPPAARVNYTTELVTVTTFKTGADYGSTYSYSCEYNGLNGTTTLTGLAIAPGLIACSVYNSIVETVNFTLYIQVNSTKLQILDVQRFVFLDSFFLDPSYGPVAGGTHSVITGYTESERKVYFKNDTSVFFTCTTIGVDTLNCTMPAITSPSLTAFSSQFLTLSNNVLSMKYIIYYPIEISIFPAVFVTDSRTQFNFTLDLARTASLTEGNLLLSFDDKNIFTAQRFTLPVGKSAGIALSLSRVGEGTYPVQLMYRNTFLFTTRNSIPISTAKQITMLNYRIISFVNAGNSTNLGYVNQTFNVTVTVDTALPSHIVPFIRCKLASSAAFIVPSVNDGSMFKCAVTVNSSKADMLQLFYVNTDVENNEALISQNSLTVVVLDKVPLQLVAPHISARDSVVVTVSTVPHLDSTYGLSINYWCKYGESFSAAFLSGSNLSCTVTKRASHYLETIEIWVSTKDTSSYNLLSSNSVQIAFTDTLAINQVNPFVSTFSATASMKYTISITSARPLLSGFRLYCRYSDGLIDNTTLASLDTDLKTVWCNLTYFARASTNHLQLSLWYDNAIEMFQLSNQQWTYVIFNESLAFDISHYAYKPSIVDQNTKLSLVVPSSPDISFSILIQKQETDSVSVTMQCTFSQASFATCILRDPLALINPVTMNSTLRIASTSSGRTFTYPIKHFVLYDKFVLKQVYPYVLSSVHASSLPTPLNIWTNKLLDPNQEIYCKITYADLTAVYSLVSGSAPSYISSCAIMGRNRAEVANVTLEFKNNSISWDTQSIYLVDNLPFYNRRGPASGNTLISVQMPAIINATTSYTYQLAFDLKGKYLQMIGCSSSIVARTVSCLTPDLKDITQDQLTITLFVNNKLALDLSPQFVVYNNPNTVQFSPKFLNFESPTTYKLKISSSKFPSANDAPVIQYLIPDNSGFKFNSTLIKCSYQDKTTLLCDTPVFPVATLDTERIDVNLTFNDENYISYPNALTGFKASNIQILELSTAEIFVGKKQEIVITGNGFMDQYNMQVYFIHSGRKVPSFGNSSRTQISCTSPLLYSLNLNTPASLELAISFDEGQTLIQNSSISVTVLSYPAVRVTPTVLETGNTIGHLDITNYPSIELDETYVRTQLYLYSRQLPSFAHYATCSPANSSCEINATAPAGTSELYLRADVWNYMNDLTSMEIPMVLPIQLYQAPNLLSVTPSVLVRQISKTLSVSFMNELPSLSPFTAQLLEPSARRSAQAIATAILSANQPSELSIDVSSLIPNAASDQTFDLMLCLTENSKCYTFPNADIGVVDKFEVYSIENPEDSDLASAYTFKLTPVMVSGNNFPFANTNVQSRDLFRLRFTTSQISVTLKAATLNITASSSSGFVFTAPLLKTILGEASYDESSLRFPYEFDIFFSFNAVDFVKYSQKFVYLNKPREPEIISSDTSVVPRANDSLIILRGENFLDVKDCLVAFPTRNLTFPATFIADQRAVQCTLPSGIAFNNATEEVQKHNSAILRLVNGKGASSNPWTINFFSELEVVSFSPNNGSTQGGYYIQVHVRYFELHLSNSAFITFGSQSSQCEAVGPVNGTDLFALRCKVEAHSDGMKTLSLGYNKKDWFVAKLGFTFTPCGAGYSSESFKNPCTLCPPGTFKPTQGQYDCIPCPKGTYNSDYGRTECFECHAYSTTINTGSNSSFDCVCVKEWMVNQYIYRTDIKDPLLKRETRQCIPCPVGGICDEFNTTKPKTLAGYWNSPPYLYEVIECKPRDACAGGEPLSCKPGYTGARCGVCESTYFKFRKYCQPCGQDAVGRFILIVVFAIIVATVLFLFTSLKVNHVSSLSIAFSFWQTISIFSNIDAKWPEVVGNSFTAASVFNFNIDFLSPGCILPGMDFSTRWIITQLIPIIFLVAFILLYILAELRSLMARVTGLIFRKFKYWQYQTKEETINSFEDKYANIENRNRFKVKLWLRTIQLLWLLLGFIKNFLRFAYNLLLWVVRDTSSRRQMRRFFNRCVNGYLTFLSFSFVFIVNNASEIFVCSYQPAAGVFTLNSSPDINCYDSKKWLTLLPFTIFIYLYMGIGALLLFIYIYAARKRLNTGDFDERFRFILKRYKKERFYWEGVVTLRKLLLSILYTFITNMILIVVSIAVIFISLLLHMRIVPFKRKFHNIMEYVVLLGTMITLFFGLLFYVNKLPFTWMQTVCVYLSLTVIIVSTIIVAISALWDINTRMKKDRKKLLRWKIQSEKQGKLVVRRQYLLPKFLLSKWDKIPFELLTMEEAYPSDAKPEQTCTPPSVASTPAVATPTTNLIQGQSSSESNALQTNSTPETAVTPEEPVASLNDIQFSNSERDNKQYLSLVLQKEKQFLLNIFESETESSEDETRTLNELFENLFSRARLRKKAKLIKQKQIEAKKKIEAQRRTLRKSKGASLTTNSQRNSAAADAPAI